MSIFSSLGKDALLSASVLATTWDQTLSWLQERPEMAVPLSLGLLAAAAWLSLSLTRVLALPAIRTVILRSPTKWDDAVLRHGTLDRLAFVVPALVVHQGITLVQSLPPTTATLLQRLAVACIALVVVRALSALLRAINELYDARPQAKNRPIKGLLQVINILAYFGAGLFIVAALLDRSPVILLSGLGAMTAILMLVFRDTILSFVAGIQITANNLIRVGDWIEMPQFNADGDVTDIALNTISVQNWDKTITVIPAHKFLENSFKNWRGMFEIGGRRIKRSIQLDLSSVRFLGEEEVAYFRRFRLLKEYLAEKDEELQAFNQLHGNDPTVPVNARRLTNVGTFRAYVLRYLREHPGINQDLYILVRQLQPTGEGLPMEVYAFTKDTRWNVYEGVQADIFDHLFAAIPQFGLRVFQNPSGADFASAFGQPGARTEKNLLSEPAPVSLVGPRQTD